MVLPDPLVDWGIAATSCGAITDAKTRNPEDPVSTSTWSMVWQFDVPGAQMVTEANNPFTAFNPAGPESTVTAIWLAACCWGAGCEDAEELLFPPPPPPPPQQARIRQAVKLATA